MKKLFLLLLIMICLPVHAQEPASIPGTFEQQAATKLPPSQIFQRKVLKGWVKENTNEDGSNRTSFLADDEIQDVDEELSSNSVEVKDFNNIINEKPPLRKTAPIPEIQKSTALPDNATNWTEKEARENLFNKIEYTKDLSAFPKKDPDYKINKRAMKAGLEKLGNKYFTLFSNESYAIRIMTDEHYNKAFYYSKNGKLRQVAYSYYPKYIYDVESLEKAKDNNLLDPYTEHRYNVPSGELNKVGFSNNSISYLFNTDKSLNCYWIGDTGYNIAGKVFMTKKTFRY